MTDSDPSLASREACSILIEHCREEGLEREYVAEAMQEVGGKLRVMPYDQVLDQLAIPDGEVFKNDPF